MDVSAYSFSFPKLAHILVTQRLSWRAKRWILVSFVFVLFLLRGTFIWWLITSGPVADAMNQYLAHSKDLVSQISSQLSWFSLTISDQWLDATSIIRIQKPALMTWSLPELLLVLDTRPDAQPAEWLGNDGNQALFVVTRSLLLINTWFLDPGPTYIPQLRLESFTTPVVLTHAVLEPVLARIGTRSERGRNALISSMQWALWLIWLTVSLMGWLFGGSLLLLFLYAMVVCIRLLVRLMGIVIDRYDLTTIVLYLFLPVSILARFLWLHRWHHAGIVLLLTIALLWRHTQHVHDQIDKKNEDTPSLWS